MRYLIIIHGKIFAFLSQVTDSIISYAGEGDYIYFGNLYVVSEKNGDAHQAYVNSYGGNCDFEYSVNDSSFIDFEHIWTNNSGYTDYFDIPEGVTTVAIRRKDNGLIYGRALVIRSGEDSIVVQNILVGNERGNSYKSASVNVFQISVDGGNTFVDILNEDFNYIPDNFFENVVVIRNKNTNEVLYKTPASGEISEKDKKNNTNVTYSYIIDGEEKFGNEFDIEESKSVKLKANLNKEFITDSIEKDINVIVVNVDSPNIELNNNKKVEIISQNIENDELEKVFFSINDGEFQEYLNEISLNPGTYIIKAYQISKQKNIRSNETEKEIIIEEKKEQTNSEKKDNKEEKNDENNNKKSEEIIENSNVINSDNKVEENIIQSNEIQINPNNPKTSDDILFFEILIILIIGINVLIIYKNEKK